MRLYARLHPPNVHVRTDHRRAVHIDGAVSQYLVLAATRARESVKRNYGCNSLNVYENKILIRHFT